MKEKVSVLGLGIMGWPVAANLLKAGYAVTVYNRTPERALKFIETLGGSRALTPRQAAEASRFVITLVGDSPDVESVILGPQGVIEGCSKDSIVIDMSTISPEVTRRIAAKLEEQGIEMLDAPVSGGEKGAINAALTIMVGGKEKVFDTCRPIFEALGKTITYMGPNGSGQLTKLCNQIIGSNTLLAVCEGLIFASKAGLDLDKTLQALSGGSAQSFMLTNMTPKIIARDFRPGFFVMHEQKDLRLALETAGEIGVALPGTGLIQQLYNAIAQDPGVAREGHFALIKALEKLASHEVKRP